MKDSFQSGFFWFHIKAVKISQAIFRPINKTRLSGANRTFDALSPEAKKQSLSLGVFSLQSNDAMESQNLNLLLIAKQQLIRVSVDEKQHYWSEHSSA